MNAEIQLRILSALLTIQFILGISLATLIDYNPAKHSAVQATFLVLHILVAVALIITASLRLVSAFKQRALRVHSALGLVSIVGAMIAGAIAASNGSNVAVFIMGLGFLAAFGAYGYSMSAVRNLGTKNTSKKT